MSEGAIAAITPNDTAACLPMRGTA